MSTCKRIMATALLMACSQPAEKSAPSPVMPVITTHGGTPLSADEIAANELTILPDGTNLPPGSGTATQGQAVYMASCAACHGLEGQGGMGTRLVGREGYPPGPPNVLAAMSVGAWPNATSIFDYVRRAMPHFAPKSLTGDQVYQVTAWILHANELIGQDEVMDAQTLPKVKMPTADLTVNIFERDG